MLLLAQIRSYHYGSRLGNFGNFGYFVRIYKKNSALVPCTSHIHCFYLYDTPHMVWGYSKCLLTNHVSEKSQITTSSTNLMPFFLWYFVGVESDGVIVVIVLLWYSSIYLLWDLCYWNPHVLIYLIDNNFWLIRENLLREFFFEFPKYLGLSYVPWFIQLTLRAL